MTVVQIHKRYYSFPENWNEVSTKQAIAIMKAICSGYTDQQLYLQLYRILSGCSWYHFLMEKMHNKAKNLHLCDFILRENGPTKQLLPQYRGLAGPADNFDNLRMNEFAFAQNFYEAYRDNGDAEALDKLVATLYRPAGGDDDMDVREPFREGTMLQRAKLLNSWPFHIKELVFVHYDGCMAQLVKDNAEIFSGSGGEPALNGIVSVMRNVAKDGTYGDFEKVERMYVKMLMLELKESKHEADKADKANK
jgi:hypothetical protein